MSDFGGSIFLPHELFDPSSLSPTPLSPAPFSYANHDGDLLNNNVIEEDNNYHPHYPNNQQHMLTTPVQRKRRGRPPGSKNKPKPPVTITRESELAMKSLTLNIPRGCCMIDWILTFARRNHVGVNVISASGSVASVMLCHPTILPMYGPFTILSLYGTLVGGGVVAAPAAIGTSYGPVNPNSTSYGSVNPNPGLVYSCPPLGILLEGMQGLVFGGMNAGRLVAASPVSVVVSTFAIPVFQWMSNEKGNDGNGDEYKKFVDYLLARLSPY